MIHLSLPDILIIVLYFGAVVFVGYRSAKPTTRSQEDFLLAGRSLTLPVFIMTLVSTWYGGILGVGEFSYRYGISNWVIQGVPYYLFAALFAILLARKVRATHLYSIPDKLEIAYDKKTAVAGAILTLVLMTPAPYVLMLSVFLQMLFGWSLLVSLIVITLTAVSYLYWGGFRSDVATDILEFVLMFIGFSVILPFAVLKYGGVEFLHSSLPPLHLAWHGGNSVQFIVVWFFIALWTLVDPAFHQRCYAAKSGDVAQKGILLSIMFWFVFDFMTAAAGLYARAAIPHLDDPMTAYPMLAEAVLPPIAKGLFYVGMLATIMSTLNTLAFVSGQTLGRDIYLRLKSRGVSEARRTENEARSVRSSHYTQFGLIVSFLISVFIAIAIPSVIKMWYTIGTIIIPGLLVPLMAGYFDRLAIPPRYAFLAMLSGCLTSLAWFLAGRSADYPLGVEPIYPGIGMSVIWWALGRFYQKKTY